MKRLAIMPQSGTPPKKAKKNPSPKKKTPVTKKQTKFVDDDGELCISYVLEKPKVYKDKGVRRHAAGSTNGAWDCKGPDKRDEDMGRCKIGSVEKRALIHQGQYLHAETVEGYLNLLCNKFHELGIRRSDGDILPNLKHFSDENGSHMAWELQYERMVDTHSGSLAMLETPKVILLLTFFGSFQFGHWTLTVIDNTHIGQQLGVFFDSCGSETGGSSFQKAKQLYSLCPFITKDITWINGMIADWSAPKSPTYMERVQQGWGTNDCGVFMCVIAALYINSLQTRGNLNRDKQEKQIVGVELCMKHEPELFGAQGRVHMQRQLKVGDFIWDKFLREQIGILWKYSK
jgi:hypothetical protein